MADNHCFEAAADFLERESTLDRLTARGTLRIALKSGGLQASSATADQIKVAIEKLLPAELSSRGVPLADVLVQRLLNDLMPMDFSDGARQSESPDDIFKRLGDRS